MGRTAMRCVQQIAMPVGFAGAGIGIEGVNTVMLCGDENDVAHTAGDAQALDP
jgi:hypothetical protein